MRKIICGILFVSIFISNSLLCQNQEVFNVNYFPIISNDSIEFAPEDMVIANNGDIIVSGTIKSGRAKPYMVIFDKNGELKWAPEISCQTKKEVKKYFPGTRGSRIICTNDSNIVMAGFYNEAMKEKRHLSDRHQAVYALKFNPKTKEIIWHTKVPSPYNSTTEDIIEKKDGNIVILAEGLPYIVEYDNLNWEYPRIIELSPNGELIKDTIIKTEQQNDFAYSLIEYNNGLAIISSSGDQTIRTKHVHLIFTDKDYNVLNDSTYNYRKGPHSKYDDKNWGYGVHEFSNGDLLLVATNTYNKEDKDWRLIKVNSGGKQLWTTSLPGTPLNHPTAALTENDEILLAGNEKYHTLRLYKFNKNGTEIFSKKAPLGTFDVVALSESNDGGIVICIEDRKVFKNKSGQFYTLKIVKTDAMGNFTVE